jgi:hypothetical protein
MKSFFTEVRKFAKQQGTICEKFGRAELEVDIEDISDEEERLCLALFSSVNTERELTNRMLSKILKKLTGFKLDFEGGIIHCKKIAIRYEIEVRAEDATTVSLVASIKKPEESEENTSQKLKVKVTESIQALNQTMTALENAIKLATEVRKDQADRLDWEDFKVMGKLSKNSDHYVHVSIVRSFSGGFSHRSGDTTWSQDTKNLEYLLFIHMYEKNLISEKDAKRIYDLSKHEFNDAVMERWEKEYGDEWTYIWVTKDKAWPRYGNYVHEFLPASTDIKLELGTVGTCFIVPKKTIPEDQLILVGKFAENDGNSKQIGIPLEYLGLK